MFLIMNYALFMLIDFCCCLFSNVSSNKFSFFKRNFVGEVETPQTTKGDKSDLSNSVRFLLPLQDILNIPRKITLFYLLCYIYL